MRFGVGIDPKNNQKVYRVCEITGVVESKKPYKMETEGINKVRRWPPPTAPVPLPSPHSPAFL